MITSGMVRFHDGLAPLMRGIDEVQQHPDNYNNGDLDKIIESVEINGVYRPIYVTMDTDYIVAGNHLWEACKTLGATEIPVVGLDIDNDTAYRIMVADNRIAALARPDDGLLLPILQRLATSDSLLGTGYSDADLSALEAIAQIAPDPDGYAQWPTICVQVPPHVRRGYYHLTEAAVGERERFELLLRLAGWVPTIGNYDRDETDED